MKPRRPVRTTVLRDPIGSNPAPYDRDDPKHPDFLQGREARVLAAQARRAAEQNTTTEED